MSHPCPCQVDGERARRDLALAAECTFAPALAADRRPPADERSRPSRARAASGPAAAAPGRDDWRREAAADARETRVALYGEPAVGLGAEAAADVAAPEPAGAVVVAAPEPAVSLALADAPPAPPARRPPRRKPPPPPPLLDVVR